MTKRRILCVCLVALLLMPMVLTGCKKEAEKNTAAYNENVTFSHSDASVQTEQYSLTWLDSYYCLMLTDKATGTNFFSTPSEHYSTCSRKDGKVNFNPAEGIEDTQLELKAAAELEAFDTQTMVSPINITFIDVKSGRPRTAYGSTDCLAKGTYSTATIDGGIRITYNFADFRISATVEYLLSGDGLEMRVPMDLLQEDDNLIYEIELAPFMASSKNDTDSYLMVPSGSGALIEAKNLSGKKEYSEAVYGADASEPITMIKRNQSQVYLPVFGSVDRSTKTGMLGIIEGGADCAIIHAQTGDQRVGYSSVSSVFRIRATEEIVYSSTTTGNLPETRYSQTVAAYDHLSLRYIPLMDDADPVTYVDMATRYRQYLQQRGYLKDRPTSVPALSVNLLGGTRIPQSLFGIPYDSDVATTTLAQAQTISAELKELVGDGSMLVSLTGFGQGGLSHTKIGGGFQLSSVVGDQDDLAALVAFAAENDIVLSMDYELSQFQNSSNGIKVNSHSALSLSTLKARVRTYVLSSAVEDDKGISWYLLGRDQFFTMADKAAATVKGNKIGVISIGTLNRVEYSDFRNPDLYTAKAGFADAVSGMLDICQDKDLQVMANNANAYVAVQADYITEVPMHSTRFNALDEDIPFYALVFQGYSPLTSSSINLATNTRDAYLQAIATGMTLQFTLCDTLHESVQFELDTAYVSSCYDDWKGTIAEMVAESADVHAAVSGQAIVDYRQQGDLSVTEFENGVTVYVNYSDADMVVDGVTVPADGFVYM